MRPILLCHDGSDDADHALREAAALLPGRETVVLHVSRSVVDWGVAPALGPLLDIPGADEAILQQARATLDAAVDAANAAGLHATGALSTTARAIWREVLEVAEARDAQLIVCGSHGSRLRDQLPLGSVARGLLAHSRRPLLVTHRRDVESAPGAGEQRVLLATDGSETADAALDAIVTNFPDADVHVAAVWERAERWQEATGVSSALLGPSDDHEARLRAAANALAERGAQLVRDHGMQAIPISVPSADGIGHAIVQLADELDADVIAVGSHGLGYAARALLGSTSHFVVQRATRPVLIVPPPLHARPSDDVELAIGVAGPA